MKKKYLLLIILMAVILLFFIYSQNKLNQHVENNVKIQQSISNNFNSILIGEKASYKNLNSEEKDIVDKYFKISGMINDQNIKPEDCYLKYYNKNIAITECPTGKVGMFVSFFDRVSSVVIDKNPYLYTILAENNFYLISPCIDNGKEAICYYKVGNDFVKVVDGSYIENKNESYVASSGPGGDGYDVQINENKLKVSVYDKRYNDNGLYKKLREVTFVLP